MCGQVITYDFHPGEQPGIMLLRSERGRGTGRATLPWEGHAEPPPGSALRAPLSWSGRPSRLRGNLHSAVSLKFRQTSEPRPCLTSPATCGPDSISNLTVCARVWEGRGALVPSNQEALSAPQTGSGESRPPASPATQEPGKGGARGDGGHLPPAGGTTWSSSFMLVLFQIFLMMARSSSLACSRFPAGDRGKAEMTLGPRGLLRGCPLHQVPTDRPDPASLFLPRPRPLLLCSLLRPAGGVPSAQTLLFLVVGTEGRQDCWCRWSAKPSAGGHGALTGGMARGPLCSPGRSGCLGGRAVSPVSKHFAESPSRRRGHNLSVEAESTGFSGPTFSTRETG